jgi:hypothetical protein
LRSVALIILPRAGTEQSRDYLSDPNLQPFS